MIKTYFHAAGRKNKETNTNQYYFFLCFCQHFSNFFSLLGKNQRVDRGYYAFLGKWRKVTDTSSNIL